MTLLSSYSSYYRSDSPPTPHFVSATKAAYISTGNTNISIDLPTGVVENDLLLFIGNTRNAYLGTPTGGGWTALFTLGILGSGGTPPDPSVSNDSLYAWYKFATATEASTIETAVTDDGTDGQYLHCLAFRHAGIPVAYDAVGDNVTPSLDVQAHDILVSLHVTAYSLTDDDIIRPPAGMVLVDKQYNATADGGSAVAFEHIAVQGTTGARTWTTNWDGTDSVATASIRIAK
jgi:hypothetical protein